MLTTESSPEYYQSSWRLCLCVFMKKLQAKSNLLFQPIDDQKQFWILIINPRHRFEYNLLKSFKTSIHKVFKKTYFV